jgi:hypothetical protein
VIGSRRRDKARRKAASATGPARARSAACDAASRSSRPLFSLEESGLEQCSDEDFGRLLDGGFEKGADNRTADATGVKVRDCPGAGCGESEA